MMQIDRSISIEDLIVNYPPSVKFMVQKGLPCFVCGEPTWGTFEEMARRMGMSEEEIDMLIEEMNTSIALENQ